MSQNTYLGEQNIDVSSHNIYGKYTPTDWVLLFVWKYGQIDGAHHKAWLLDQIVRILKGATVKVTEARWTNSPSEYRFEVLDDSPEYTKWVKEYEADGEYEYDIGIAP